MNLRVAAKDPGFTLLGVEVLQKRLGDVQKELDGVRKSEDIEFVHRMRVASRRMRCGLDIFGGGGGGSTMIVN